VGPVMLRGVGGVEGVRAVKACSQMENS
jgi:hypothetical protein